MFTVQTLKNNGGCICADWLSWLQVDGDKNPKIQSIFLEKFPITKAHFSTDGREVNLHLLYFFPKSRKASRGSFMGTYRRLRERANMKIICQFNGVCVPAICYIQRQPVPDWDGTRDEAILVWIIFGKHLYVTFFMVAFVISFNRDYMGWHGGFQCAHLQPGIMVSDRVLFSFALVISVPGNHGVKVPVLPML